MIFKDAALRQLLVKTRHLAKNKRRKIYLVGGFLRDLLLKRRKPNPDFDFCLKKGAIAFGRALSKIIGCGFVILDKDRGYCRLVKKIDGSTCTLDFTDFRGADLVEDLLHRDFTINAMAMDLDNIFSDRPAGELMIDPYSGRQDLESGIIRIVHKKNFLDDPLRILRAFSLSAIFGFKIDRQTLKLMQRDKKNISAVSAERIRDELFKILDTPKAFDCLIEMDKLKILDVIIPEIKIMRGLKQGPYHHLDVWQHSLETLRQTEILISELKNSKEIQSYLDEIISSDRKRRSILKLGAILHDIGKPAALRHKAGKTIFHGHERIGRDISEEIIKRLKLSNDDWGVLSKMVFWHLRPGYLADNQIVSRRAKFRYFRDAGSESISVLLLSIADQRSTRGRLTSEGDRAHHEKICLALIREHMRQAKIIKPRPFINGDTLIRKFKLKPSPLIGKVLSELEELQAIGKVKSKEEALRAAKKFIK
ncbi:MAG: HD domain-containing protein [Candidatus Omnitrophica bacterium]|nr:HD domain-containing protein [Candidatus Omnitrophota bacterium]